MQTTNVKIKFETFNEHNFLIDIAGSDAAVLQGLTLLQEELPAEISFHVPESYHKRIIGVGGRSIQRIMKKYGVYVKFSNAEEFAAMGGYNDNEDNVIARTPAKNAMNLDNLKQAVMELVNPKASLISVLSHFLSDIASNRTRTTLTRRSLFQGGITARFSGKRVSLFTTSKRRPTALFASPTRKPLPTSSPFSGPSLRSRSPRPCSLCVRLAHLASQRCLTLS